MTAPLKNLRVLDLGWVMVGPMSGRYLADLGAEVFKVESSQRIDPLRTLGPFKDGTPGPERSLSYHFINAGKRSITLDISSESGREVVRALAREVDVVIESFTPGVMERLGLGYEALKADNPGLIMVSTCILGQNGPAAGTSGVGTLGAAYAGVSFLIGWPDRPPAGPYSAWTDSVAPRFVVASVLSALHRRKQTGEGCYIDVSQSEAGVQFLLPAYFDYAGNGNVPQRAGNTPAPLRSPSGIYRCAGEDRWVAIDASQPDHWRALAELLGHAAADGRYATLVGRLRHRNELDALVEAWTSMQADSEVESTLQTLGIPAHMVCHAEDLDTDADLATDEYLQPVYDPIVGAIRNRGATFDISPCAPERARPGPRIGDSTDAILQEIAGMSPQRISELRESGALK
jgi:benzylsuccinate CoA-transferase BbsF subunit